jgi:biphenyl 2,3-dioxygenase beta subunit
MTMVALDLLREVEQFLYQEARLLDERRFHEWIELFTEDVHYWMPTRSNRYLNDLQNELSKPGELAFFDDDLTMLRGRVARLDTCMAWAEDPPSRTTHLITNVQIDGVEGDEVRVHCTFMVHRGRNESEQDLFFGYRDDVLRRVDGSFKIAKRTIVLGQSVLSAKNLSIFF